MKLKIKETDVLTLNNIKGKMLMLSDCNKVYRITEFKTSEEEITVMEKPSLFKKAVPVQKKQLFLTEVEILAWHSTGKFLGIMADNSAEWILRRDLYYLRQNWVNFCEMLRGFGLQVTQIPEEMPEAKQLPTDTSKQSKIQFLNL
jgi:hypothetical protein